MTASAVAASGAGIRLRNLVKTFGSFRAVDDVSLDVPAGSFVTLLGPSGSGKTTTLNLIAGFIEPDAGEILADGEAISQVPPHKRNIGMVFQSYALFPHMTVLDNVAFPLRMRSRLSGSARRKRALEALELVKLSGLEARYPRQLSGGQQQRVSMARALVSQPRLLLMDEPLGALDKKLRENMQLEIKQIHRQVGSTFVYVTHDQGEALTMSDLIVVMNNGRIVQAAGPREIYTRPATRFVADFLGQANLLPARVMARDDEMATVRIADSHEIKVPVGAQSVAQGDSLFLLLRPEAISLADGPDAPDGTETLDATLADTIYLGDSVRLVVEALGERLQITCPAPQWQDRPAGSPLRLNWLRANSGLVREDD